ncbi:tRNA (adenosine(37)-N6)-threonylcarbamoyltransferase complex dimerization subunit type 1 TsaB [Thermosyntropha sp.]|uniref:tRNA (adenosine(37)-N6)-threonylcarbamoyltransferase complex dimerization subunit type 1 TsaB n=1 Tax=Thermosyntropha sp. TaxID=2740820 RepID=UPI0025D6C2AF|nr:tRNA (adenosine(37)-N6)-threonylcarbamoyltransferase complex dimerization subunit type 1 TsaB [Thermosyntropha sp.]MBO8158256.1 tRNA (adenosine(37)-N6)-threonylcarbamoyltransferase complex dimerization subunit type 1 TsaB [Thermosyntropha sp.]
MLVLAVDSATPVAGVAVLNRDKVLYEEFCNYKKTHSETLLPMIDRALKVCECTLDDITALAVTIGPGSFTGLRIGMGTVKGLSLASGKPVVTISTLDMLAANALYAEDLLIVPVLDARKNEVYSAIYEFHGIMQKIVPEKTWGTEELVLKIEEEKKSLGKKGVIMLGDGFYPYEDYWRNMFGENMFVPPPHLMLPRAAAMGVWAFDKIEKEDFADIWTLSPVYLRLSEAEYRLRRGEL